MADDFEDGSIAAANAIIGFLRGRGFSEAADATLAAWNDGTITGPVIEPSRTQETRDRGAAVLQGFTGDQCDNCGSMKMQQTGHCKTCAECGTTTGCS